MNSGRDASKQPRWTEACREGGFTQVELVVWLMLHHGGTVDLDRREKREKDGLRYQEKMRAREFVERGRQLALEPPAGIVQNAQVWEVGGVGWGGVMGGTWSEIRRKAIC